MERAEARTSVGRELAANGVLWLALVTSLVAFRGFAIYWFRAELSPRAGVEAVWRCFDNGVRFDVSVATYAVLPSLLPAALALVVPLGRWPERMRRVLAALLLVLWPLALIADLAYFTEYHDQFDHWIFGLVYDDRSAIAATIWKTYPVPALFALWAVAALGSLWIVGRLVRRASRAAPPSLERGWLRAGTFALVLALSALGLRGSLGRRPLQEKDIATTGDELLNKLVPNPLFALYTAIRAQRSLEAAQGVRNFLPDGDVRAAAQALFPERRGAGDLDASLERRAPGAVGAAPPHVFLVVMESYDSWALQPKFASLHLTDRLEALGAQGIFVRAFVSGGSGTMLSLGALITGLPATGLPLNYLPEVRAGLPTSAPGIFRRLGYRTRFFYGGYLSWQRIGDFAREQGFDEVYGGDRMSPQLSGNEWGVDDDVLFAFVLAHTDAVPTFDVIMSTSYHPPFSVDLAAKGFDLEALRANPLCRALSSQQLRALGHLWYSDQALGDFVRGAEQRLERPLFALTGDHYSREESVNPRPTLYESSSVPLVLYGHEALARAPRLARLAGSHLDIVPTLVDLVAPAGFSYHAFGRDLLDPAQPQVGYGNDTVITPDLVLAVRHPENVQDLDGNPPNEGVPAQELVQRYRQLLGLGWWRAERGSAWPD